ncbi:MAG: nitrogen fixation protein NifR [Bacteriovoracaceae bacterium]|nr:nitrogen fixation protein NifR [Bacteriovoracaceae bacterium]
MAGYTDPPYRDLLQEFKVPVLFTEMIDSHALIHRNEKTMKMLGKRDPDLFTQIAAGTPQLADHAMNILLEEETAGININMGCPAKKVTSCGGGSNLLRAPSVIKEICQVVRKKTSIPFSVKFRSGWNADLINYKEVGKIYEGEGVDFVMLHARTRAEAFSGHSNWDHIRDLKQNLKIPVIGNGDIVSYESAKAMFEHTGCDGVAIGRGAIGNPWLYLQADAALKGLPPLPEPAPEERLRVMVRHYELMLQYFDIRISSHLYRKNLVGYLRGLPGHKAVKEAIFADEAVTVERLKNTLGEYFETLKNFFSGEQTNAKYEINSAA